MLLLALVGISVMWNHSVKEELAQQATMFVRRTLSAGENRRVIESLNGVRLASFESITQFDREGQRVVTLPPSIAPVAYNDRGLWHRLVNAETKTTLFLDDEGEKAFGTLSFVYPRFGLASYASGVWFFLMFFLGMMLSTSQRKLTKEFEREIEFQQNRSMNDLIQKVRHNIRSPLAVLGAYFTAPKQSELNLKEQGQRAVRRIEEILSEMETGGQSSNSRHEFTQERALIEISMLAEQIVEEKRLITPNISITYSASPGAIYTTIPAMDFKTTLSNVIDNSIQAIEESGSVSISLEGDGHLVSLVVTDTGRGIVEALIPKLTQKNFTFGKEGGSGLGLFYAQKLMDDHRGSLQIESEVGNGTSVSFFFPQAREPSWHCGEISLAGIRQVDIYDDQVLVLDLFRQKFSSRHASVQYHLVDQVEPRPIVGNDRIHLMDFDFGSGKRSGLQIISEAGIAKQTVLVTGHYDDPAIQSACATIGCRLLPKDRISSIKIVG